jgi:hypothetical protein
MRGAIFEMKWNAAYWLWIPEYECHQQYSTFSCKIPFDKPEGNPLGPWQ